MYYYYLPLYLVFNWRIIALQSFVIFCQTSTRISHRYTHISSFLTSPHLPPHPSLLDGHRAPVWASWVIGQIPIGYLFYIWYCKFPCVLLYFINVAPVFHLKLFGLKYKIWSFDNMNKQNFLKVSFKIREMQTNNILSFLLIRLVELQKLDNSLNWQVYGETRFLTIMKMKNGTTLWRGFGKPIYHLVFDPLLELYSKNILSKVYHHHQQKSI